MIPALADSKNIDPERVAVLGHSHGASLAYYFATHSSSFCALIAVNGRADWERQALYGDAYLVAAMDGSPHDHPDLYHAFSPLRNVAELSSPLLAVAGTEDGQIPWWNASTFAAAALARGADVTMLLFDGEGHHVARKENREILRKATLGLLASTCDE